MKRALLVLSLAFALCGCAFLGKQYDYARLCSSDPACLSEAKQDAALVGTVAGAAYPPIAGAATAAALCIFLWWRGKQKAKVQ